MDHNWASKPTDNFYLPTASNSEYPSDVLNLFPFDDSMFPFQDASTSLPDSQFKSYSPTLTQFDSPYAMVPSASRSGSTEADERDSVSAEIGFDSMTPPLVISGSNSPLDEWLLNPTTGEVTLSSESVERDGSKRSRTNVDDDINACWRSPLCPNKKDDGSRPDSCKGECADYLFSHPSELPEDKKILSEILAKSEPKITLEPPHRQLKRTEMETKPEVSGRTLKDRSLSSSSTRDAKSSLSKSVSPRDTTKSDRSTASPIEGPGKPKGRVPHNQVEKKYRENVNAQLDALRRVVPVSKQQLVGFDGLDIEDLASSARQPSKAVVLSSATAYIKQLEKENTKLLEELAALKSQNKTLQSLVKCDDCSLMNYVRRWKIQPPVQ